MRTPPPVLPPRDEHSEPERSWLQQQGADGLLSLRMLGPMLLIFAVSFGFGMGAAQLRGWSGTPAMLFALVMALVLTALGGLFIHKSVNAAGAGFLAVVLPTGKSVPYEEQYSPVESMVARGDVAGAIESYESIIAQHPDAALPRIRAAELHAKGGRDPRRAADLFRSVRELPGTSSSDVLYASNRLVDLYDGPLEEPGRALVELRRIIERFPGTTAATRAKVALTALKARRNGGAGEA